MKNVIIKEIKTLINYLKTMPFLSTKIYSFDFRVNDRHLELFNNTIYN